MFVRLQSWDDVPDDVGRDGYETFRHEEARRLEGKKVRITVEEV